MNYNEIENKVIKHLDNTPFCVLATASRDGVVSACQMSLINDRLKVYL